MSRVLSNNVANKRRRNRQKKMTAVFGAGQNAANVARSMDSVKTSEVTFTVTDAQRQNRQATQKWKAKARKFAFGIAVGLHAAAIIAFGIWFIQKTVLQMNVDKIESIVLKDTPPQNKRTIAPRKSQKTVKPKAVKVLAPERGAVVTNANISATAADFTIPMDELQSENTIELTAMGYETSMVVQSRHVNIVSTVPKFEIPKFESTELSMNLDMGSSLVEMDFEVSEDMGLSASDFGETKQTLSEFLRLVRERIKEFQRFPPSVKHLEEGSSTTIRFTLFKDGTIRDTKVSSSSGSRVLDNAALAAVQNAEPYPPFPDSQVTHSIRLELPINFQLMN